ncbi:MAG: WD40 repeat domain-containing protein [Chthonomonas sp.]|nr:WD40 repeat domain-containing protein [Chthonomonas sp.]
MITAVITTALLAQQPITVNRRQVLSGLQVLNVCAAPKGATFAASMEDSSVRIFDAVSGRTVRSFVGHPQPVYGLGFNPAGTILATGDETARIYLWNVKTGAKIREFTRTSAHTRGVISISFSSDGKRLVTSGRDDFLIVWDVATGKPLKKIPGGGANVASAAYNLKNGNFYAATLGQGLMVYPKAGGQKSYGGHRGLGISDFAINAAGTRGVTGGRDNAVTAWDVMTGKSLGTMAGHDDMVMHVAIAPNGRVVASSSIDRTVRIWSLSGFKPVGRLDDQSAVGAPLAFTADGKYMISSTVSDMIQINTVSPSQAK